MSRVRPVPLMQIQIRDLQHTLTDLRQLEQVLRAGAEKLCAPLDSLSIVLVDDERMSILNRELLGRSGPTDVIAFEGERDEEGRSGEIIISVETAVYQAQEYSHSLAWELCLLAVHGLLHVLGYEDASPEGRAEMQRIQQKLMAEICPRE